MSTYLVECTLPGGDLESLELLCQAADTASRQFAAEGMAVRFLRATFTPGRSSCSFVFEASIADLVQAVTEAAQIPYNRIDPAVELSPAETSERPP